MENGNFGFGTDGIFAIIMLLIVAGLFTNGGFGFGGNSAGVTEEYIANQFSNRDIWSTNTNVLTSASATQNEILNNRANCNNNYSNLRYDMATGQAGLEKDILLGNQTIQAQMASCCCDIKQAIANDGAATRALIQDNTIQALRDKIADKDREALATGLSYSTSLSVSNAKSDILNSLGNYYPKIGVNPYYIYGYGTTYSGTTIY